ncbi:MAG: 16S rRNA (uracil(1498)-N(3))-methyltransferase, partial [Clostridiales bacterium]|nr:16S rRNA (uracil(1498)-N(3))-methyltransferase [Clostridiales bacterium]
MHRFFIDENLISDNHAVLSTEDSQHAIKVLRLAENDLISVCDGNSFDYDAKIVSANKTAVELELSNKRNSETESATKVTLIQCLPKSGKMEVIIQKCVELGVYDIVPVESIRSVVKVSKSKQVKTERYNRISYEAAKQSQRGIIPKVHNVTELSKIDYSEFDYLLVPYEEEQE